MTSISTRIQIWYSGKPAAQFWLDLADAATDSKTRARCVQQAQKATGPQPTLRERIFHLLPFSGPARLNK